MSDTDASLKTCTECDQYHQRTVLHRTTGELHRIKCPCAENLPIKFVFQSLKASCMVACVAMIAGVSESHIMRNFYHLQHDFSEEGSHLHDATSILDKHYGFAYQTRTSFYSPTQTPRENWPELWGAPIYLASVRNLRDATRHGVVVIPDGRVLDPAAGVIQGLHRYPAVYDMTAFYKIEK